MPVSGSEVAEYFIKAGYMTLDISTDHADPFDMMLVAQALVEPMRLLTHDKVISLYSDTVIFV